MSEISLERFSKKLEVYIALGSLIGSVIVLGVWQNLNFCVSFLVGNFLGFLNFKALKRDVLSIVSNVISGNLHYSKAGFVYIIKFFLRLILIALILYFLLVELKLNVIFILLGFSIIYFHLVVLSLKNFLKNRVITN